MKKIFVFLLSCAFLLAACAVEQQIPATEPALNNVIATPDAGMATPIVGFAIVKKLEGMQALLLSSRPESESPQAGRVAPGENGKLLGINKAGTWVLLQFPDQTGWAPIEALDITFAQ